LAAPARAKTTDALAELDRLSLRPASTTATNPDDQEAVAGSLEQVRDIARAQDEAIGRVAGRLAAP
jgi:hypothetical protein